MKSKELVKEIVKNSVNSSSLTEKTKGMSALIVIKECSALICKETFKAAKEGIIQIAESIIDNQ